MGYARIYSSRVFGTQITSRWQNTFQKITLKNFLSKTFPSILQSKAGNFECHLLIPSVILARLASLPLWQWKQSSVISLTDIGCFFHCTLVRGQKEIWSRKNTHCLQLILHAQSFKNCVNIFKLELFISNIKVSLTSFVFGLCFFFVFTFYFIWEKETKTEHPCTDSLSGLWLARPELGTCSVTQVTCVAVKNPITGAFTAASEGLHWQEAGVRAGTGH